tara:strand:+ start:405 stop:602 length:198 start_codon:yes stop_codon:yes gene_type:complete
MPQPFVSDSSQPPEPQQPIAQTTIDDDVVVSMVSKRADGHGTKYEDVVYVGPVDTFVRFIDTNVV